MICNPEIKNRIKRAQGQMNGVLQMIEDGATCMEIVTQLKAIRASIEKSIGLLTTTNLIQTIESNHQIELKDLDEAINLIIKGI